MYRPSPTLAVLAFLTSLGSGHATPTASLRALVPGADRPANGLYATPSLAATYGYLHSCVNCTRDPPEYTPWALLTHLDSPNLDQSFLSAVDNNASAIIVIVDKLSSDTRLVTRYVVKHAFNERYIRKLVYIPIVTISKVAGEKLFDLSTSNRRVPVFVSPGESFRYETFILLLLAVTIVLFILCIVSVQACKRRLNPAPATTVRSPYQIAVSKIPTQEVTDDQDPLIKEEHKCAVCIEGYQVKEFISLLPCSHIFHKSCIEPWLLSKRLCPMCKMDVIKFYGPINLGSEESIVDISLDQEIVVNNIRPAEVTLSFVDEMQPDRESLSSVESLQRDEDTLSIVENMQPDGESLPIVESIHADGRRLSTIS